MAPSHDPSGSKKPPSSSPAELLWAYQMKRENAALISRMQKLEAHLSRFEAEAASKDDGGAKIAGLEKRLDAFSQQREKEDERLRKEALENFESLKGDVETITSQVEALRGGVGKIQEVEDRLKEYESALTNLGRVIDEEKMEAIRSVLKELREKIDSGEETQQGYRERVEALQESAATLKEGYEELQGQIRELQARPVQQIVVPVTEIGPGERLEPAAQPDKTTKSTAGAKTNTTKGRPLGSISKKAVAKPQMSKGGSKGITKISADAVRGSNGRLTRAAAAPETQPAEVAAAPRGKTQAKDKAILRSGRGWFEVARTPSNETAEAGGQSTKVAPAPKTLASGAIAGPGEQAKVGNKPILRAGRGWIEVARTPSKETAENIQSSSPDFVAANGRRGRFHSREARIERSIEQTAPVKRGRGRPRKDQGPSAEMPVEATVPVKRGRGRPRKDQSQPALARGTKRKAPVETQKTATHGTRGRAANPADIKDEHGNENDGGQSAEQESGPGIRPTQEQSEPAPPAENEEEDLTHGHTTVTTPQPVQKMHKNIRRGLTNVFTSPISSPPTMPAVSRRLDFKGKGKQPIQGNAVQSPPEKRRRIVMQDSGAEPGGYLKMYSDWAE